ncbi:hypothetical protein LMG19083_04921 [Ralstonia psammae]|uniref:Type IV secretion system protein VirB9 n=1 Tax=Ralstonia psammae TaxID=3058598 RepID=A0ABM9JZI7_9RALS|nr:TrbG/VirB9 family P-type conjugative transfer protein [Ralstonia sp. LMG 19083]CAJ0809389.1 hypothetical protein LMG19083_04921 [Ralstonia sp. LMG 19083]
MRLTRRSLQCSAGVVLALGSLSTFAEDARLRTVTYDSARVVPINVQVGFAVQIVLGADEHIEAAGSGLNSHCEDSAATWCVVARKGEHNIYINAHAGAAPTNLFVQTDRRNYSFDLNLLSDGRAAQVKRVYRVAFAYPDEAVARQQAQASAREAALRIAREESTLKARQDAAPVARNWNYTMQALPGGDAIQPTAMFDDGRFTYLKFPNNREIPSVYMVSEDGSESLLQWHVERGMLVVHRVAKRFVLRDGNAVVGLWNEAYDSDGVPPSGGVTTPGVERVSVPASSGMRPVLSAPLTTAPQVASPQGAANPVLGSTPGNTPTREQWQQYTNALRTQILLEQAKRHDAN